MLRFDNLAVGVGLDSANGGFPLFPCLLIGLAVHTAHFVVGGELLGREAAFSARHDLRLQIVGRADGVERLDLFRRKSGQSLATNELPPLIQCLGILQCLCAGIGFVPALLGVRLNGFIGPLGNRLFLSGGFRLVHLVAVSDDSAVAEHRAGAEFAVKGVHRHSHGVGFIVGLPHPLEPFELLHGHLHDLLGDVGFGCLECLPLGFDLGCGGVARADALEERHGAVEAGDGG